MHLEKLKLAIVYLSKEAFDTYNVSKSLRACVLLRVAVAHTLKMKLLALSRQTALG